eukprot:gene9648-1852_t
MERTNKNCSNKSQGTKFKITNDSDIVTLNVGGNSYSTTYQTINQTFFEKQNYFTTLLSGNFGVLKDDEGRIFIDRDGSNFKYILNYFRSAGIPEKICFPKNEQILEELRIEFEYYQLEWPFILPPNMKNPSCLISDDELLQMNEWCEYNGNWKLIYKATRDGFSVHDFRSLCSDKGPNFCVIKTTNGCIFGGYTKLSCKLDGKNSKYGSYRYDPKSFIFSFYNPNGKQKVKCPNNGTYNVTASVKTHTTSHITFGATDLSICNNSNVNRWSFSNLGSSFTVEVVLSNSKQLK